MVIIGYPIARARRDGWFRTGDLGHFDDAGYLYWLGRLSTLIVTEGSKNIQPEDVERAYLDHPVLCPPCPCIIHGAHRALPVRRRLPRLFRTITVVFGEPTDPEQLTQEGVGQGQRERIVTALHQRLAELIR